MTKPTSFRQVIRWLGVLASLSGLVFSLMLYFGMWDKIRGTIALNAISGRFDLSYAQDASKPVRVTDPDWPSVMRLITEYATDRIPHDGRIPLLLARAQAVSSTNVESLPGIPVEWTAPTTPLFLFYREWPNPGSGPYIPGKDVYFVGNIGDLHEWIRRDRSDFDFFWRTIIFGAISTCVALFLALPEK